MRLRVHELAERAGVSVDVIRSYQSKGLLSPPRHEGRVAHYDDGHLARLRAIRDLKARGHSLRAIAGLLEEHDPGTTQAQFTARVLEDEERMSLVELAERTRVPPAMLRSLEASGVIKPHRSPDERRYTGADARAVRLLLSLVGGGVPMEEFMAVARAQLAASDDIAAGATELFMKYVREPLLASGMPRKEEAERLAASFRMLVTTASALIAYHVERSILTAVQTAIDEKGTPAERQAIGREVRRRRSVA